MIVSSWKGSILKRLCDAQLTLSKMLGILYSSDNGKLLKTRLWY